MIIRPAQATDYQELMQLYNALVNKDRYSNHQSDSFMQVLESETSYIYVAEEKDRLVGMVTFSVRPVVRYPKPLVEIDELFVGVPFRRKGIGTQLLQAVIDKARELDCFRIYAETPYVFEMAQPFYENLAFKNFGYHFMRQLGGK